MSAASRHAGPMRLLAMILLLACVHPGLLPGQERVDESIDELYARAQESIRVANYETAVKTLMRAKELFPEATEVNLALGKLYYDKELYSLALDEYREAEGKGALDFTTLTQISRCYGKLNQERSSIEYLTRILEQYPDSPDTVDDLGWMYFKTHQLEKGEQVLRAGIDTFGALRELAMTLGTIYAGMNRYEEARSFYLQSIEDALGSGDRNFASIAYYNLSLLEHNFFRYNSALRFTDESIALEDRSSGHLSRGELFQSRMDFRVSLEEFQKAYAKDTTPLSKLNLALLYQRFGYLELARRYAEEVMGTKDLAWLMYYGTDTTRHFKDLHELLKDVYTGLMRTEAARPTAGLVPRITALFSSLRYRMLAWYHRQSFRSYSLRVGREYLTEGSTEDAYWEFYKGNEGYVEVAAKYLGIVREVEIERTPHAERFYMLEEGKLRGSVPLLQESLKEFDPFWEREAMAEALASMIPLLTAPSEAPRRREAIAQLFGLNSGALPQAGLGLPLVIEFRGEGWTGREKALIRRYLKRAGSECVESRAEGFHFLLSMERGTGGGTTWSVTDMRASRTAVQGHLDPPGGRNAASAARKARAALLVQSILDELYFVD